MAYIEMKAQEDNKPIKGQVATFMQNATLLIEMRQSLTEGEPA